MSTQIIQELDAELNRLFMAGSDLVAGDFRMKRLLPQLAKLGEKSPVFKKLSEGTAAIVEGKSGEEAAVSLQELGGLVHAILRTQGGYTPQATGTIANLPQTTLTVQASQNGRRVQAVIKALSTKGSGRWEIVEEAFKDGIFADIRLVYAAIQGLDDAYSEIVDLIVQRILPSYGEAIVPYLLTERQAASDRIGARIVKVLGLIGGSEANETIKQLAQDATEATRAAAIESLGGSPDQEANLLEWSHDAKKAVREASYRSLLELATPAANARLYEAISGKDRVLVAELLRGRMGYREYSTIYSHPVISLLIPDLYDLLDQLLEHREDSKKAAKIIKQLEELSPMLESKEQEDLYPLFARILQEHALFTNLLPDRIFIIALMYMEQFADKEMLALMWELEQKKGVYVSYSLRAALRLLTPAELYDHYSTYKKGALATTLVGEMEHQLEYSGELQVPDEYIPAFDQAEMGYKVHVRTLLPVEQIKEKWDPRWLEWALSRKEERLVAAFVTEPHPEATAFLAECLKRSTNYRYWVASFLLDGLERACQDPAIIQETILYVLKKNASSVYSLMPIEILRILRYIPLSSKPQLEELAEKLRYSSKQQMEQLLIYYTQKEKEVSDL